MIHYAKHGAPSIATPKRLQSQHDKQWYGSADERIIVICGGALVYRLACTGVVEFVARFLFQESSVNGRARAYRPLAADVEKLA